jgi:hypothetical protein
MSDKCILNDNMYIYRIFGILFLIIILISSLIYYVYISKKKIISKDTFIDTATPSTTSPAITQTSSSGPLGPSLPLSQIAPAIQTVNGAQSVGCFVKDQGQMNVEMRPCSIYMTTNEELCDKYEKYYQMSITKLDKEIQENIDDTELHDKLLIIKDDRINNLNKFNQNTCKYTFNNWMEINKVYDSKFPNADNEIKPHKNINRIEDYNFSLTNTCFKEYISDPSRKIYTDISDINKKNIVSSFCDEPINNVQLYNSEHTDRRYLTVNFKNVISYDELKESVCSNPRSYNLQQYISGNYILKLIYNNNSVVDISVIKYEDRLFHKITDLNILNTVIQKFFRFSYDNTLNNIIYTIKRIITNAYICNFDMCNNIINLDPSQISFLLSDIVSVPDTNIINIQLTELKSKLSEKIDNNVDTADYYQLILDNINIVKNNYDKKIISIAADIRALNGEISDLNRQIESDKGDIRNLDNNIASYIKNIQNLIDSSDSEIITYINRNIDEANNNCSKSYTESKTNYDNNISSYNTSLIAYNQANDRYSASITNLNTNFERGLWFLKKDYNSGIFTQRYIYTESDFNSALSQNSHFRQSIIKIAAPRDPYFADYNSSYISLFGDANSYDYFTLEIFGNIKFDKSGYYQFMLNADDAGDMFIAYRDANNNLVYKNVANYYNGHPPDMGSGACQTTKYPIYIDANLNGGYYGLYLRVQEVWGGAYINPYYTFIDPSQYTNKRTYKLTDTFDEYIPFVYLDSFIRTNMRSLNKLNNGDPYRIHKNISDINTKDFYVKIDINTYSNPGTAPNRPTECAVIPHQTPFPAHNAPSKTSEYYTPIQIDTKYITDVKLREYRDSLNGAINTIRANISTDYNTSNLKLQDINRLNNIISNKNTDIESKNRLIRDEQRIIDNLSSIKNTLNTFDNFKTFDNIKSLFTNNKITTNLYDKYIFSDNDSNKYIYIQIPDV